MKKCWKKAFAWSVITMLAFVAGSLLIAHRNITSSAHARIVPRFVDRVNLTGQATGHVSSLALWIAKLDFDMAVCNTKYTYSPMAARAQMQVHCDAGGDIDLSNLANYYSVFETQDIEIYTNLVDGNLEIGYQDVELEYYRIKKASLSTSLP
ncbi:MAG: hypothetical protein H8D34_02600 [Chloroflexi bacterium]|nr:hypothetical protein [Chloroflexota bacterium]